MLSLFTATDINIHQMGSKSGKRSTCKGGKNIKKCNQKCQSYTLETVMGKVHLAMLYLALR